MGSGYVEESVFERGDSSGADSVQSKNKNNTWFDTLRGYFKLKMPKRICSSSWFPILYFLFFFPVFEIRSLSINSKTGEMRAKEKANEITTSWLQTKKNKQTNKRADKKASAVGFFRRSITRSASGTSDNHVTNGRSRDSQRDANKLLPPVGPDRALDETKQKKNTQTSTWRRLPQQKANKTETEPRH